MTRTDKSPDAGAFFGSMKSKDRLVHEVGLVNRPFGDVVPERMLIVYAIPGWVARYTRLVADRMDKSRRNDWIRASSAAIPVGADISACHDMLSGERMMWVADSLRGVDIAHSEDTASMLRTAANAISGIGAMYLHGGTRDTVRATRDQTSIDLCYAAKRAMHASGLPEEDAALLQGVVTAMLAVGSTPLPGDSSIYGQCFAASDMAAMFRDSPELYAPWAAKAWKAEADLWLKVLRSKDLARTVKTASAKPKSARKRAAA